jgi:L-threonylcarbamoyladenylate synthase
VKTLIRSATEENLKHAAEIIKSGGVIAFPTETVYGLGANAFDAAAVERIFALKGRPTDNPLIVHIADKSDVSAVAYTTRAFEILAGNFWPGALTVVLKARGILPTAVTAGLDTVAVRMPKNGAARELIRLSGVPVAAPSANLSGNVSPTLARHVMEDFSGLIPLIIDGGACEVGIESTVVDATGERVQILRQGSITLKDIEAAGLSVIDCLPLNGEPPRSPGMRHKHYRPKNAKVKLLNGSAEQIARFISDNNADNGFFVSDNIVKMLPESIAAGINIVSAGNGENEAAAGLYAAFRELDGLRINTIYVEPFNERGIGKALRDRLSKAAEETVCL